MNFTLKAQTTKKCLGYVRLDDWDPFYGLGSRLNGSQSGQNGNGKAMVTEMATATETEI